MVMQKMAARTGWRRSEVAVESRSLLVSTAIAVGGAAAFHLVDTRMSGGAGSATVGAILIAVPILQSISADAIETRTGRR